MQPVIRSPLQGTARLISEDRAINVPITVPGSVYDALITAGLLEDPFYGLNELQSQWVHETDWTIFTDFTVPPEIESREHIFCKFYGIDTFATILLNDNVLGSADNMHREYEFEITPWIIAGTNRLTLRFQSPSRVARELHEADNERIKPYPGQLPGRVYAHKAQYSFGWDWGPALSDIGIWRPVEFIGTDDARLLDFQVIPTFTTHLILHPQPPSHFVRGQHEADNKRIRLDPGQQISWSFAADYARVNLAVNVHLGGEPSAEKSLQYRAILRYMSPQPLEFEQIEESDSPTLSFELEPQLWWIAEIGLPNLYHIEVQLVDGGEVIDSLSARIGIRDLKLIRRADEWGETFFFQLNGVPIFAKGADWIPVHSFIPKGRRLNLIQGSLNDAVAAHMNMLRIWGGGVMEDDAVYDFCDEHGILLWQDFPFACGFNPLIRDVQGDFNAFYRNTAILATQNVVRLRNHPSLALWSGNNEIEEWIEYSLKSDPDRATIVAAYCDLFERLLPAICAEQDPTRSYWPSSPSSGGSNCTGVFPDPHAENVGDNHFWSVWHGGWDFTAYRDNFSRFMSEFGFESFPDLKTCAEFCPPDQFEFESPVMRNHQKNTGGNQKILDYMRKRFTIPDDFAKQVVLSQLTQAEAIEYGVEHWRRNRSQERCMGTLYWQLNDCWPVASWSSVDYSGVLAEHYGRSGRWKALHYFARRFYRPTIVSVAEAPDFSEIWAVNDLNVVLPVHLAWQVLDTSGTVWEAGEGDFALDPCTSTKLAVVDLREHFGYRWLQLNGRWSIGAGETLLVTPVAFANFGLAEENLPSSNLDSPEPVTLVSLLAGFIDYAVQVKVYPQSEGYHKMPPSNVIGATENYFEGRCLVNEDGQVCIHKRIVPSNPEEFDVPLAELLDPFLDRDDIIVEIAALTRNPPLILAAQLSQGDSHLSETFKAFTPPGNLPLEDPHLAWSIVAGEGREWTVEISTEKPALYVHLASDTLDFWADDNYFFLGSGKAVVTITFLENLTEDDLMSQIRARSLRDLLS